MAYPVPLPSAPPILTEEEVERAIQNEKYVGSINPDRLKTARLLAGVPSRGIKRFRPDQDRLNRNFGGKKKRGTRRHKKKHSRKTHRR